MDHVNEYRFTDEDLFQVLNFIKNYHLNPTKGLRGRTNQGKRGFGGELDEWVPGKLIEIGTCKILESFGSDLRLLPDFEIYSNKEVGERSDPDITRILEEKKGVERNPKLFLEIKRLEENSKWLGPRSHQLKGIDRASNFSNDEIFMIHTSIEFEDNKSLKERDITASILSRLSKSNSLDLSAFSEFSDLVARIQYIYSLDDLHRHGQIFPKGSIIPETDFPSSMLLVNKDGTIRKGFAIKHQFEGTHNLKMRIESSQEEPEYGDWEIDGEFWIATKNKKDYIHAVNETVMFNKVFGKYFLEKGRTYKFHFVNKLGKDTYKNIDDVWLSKKRLDELYESDELRSVDVRLNEIINKI